MKCPECHQHVPLSWIFEEGTRPLFRLFFCDCPCGAPLRWGGRWAVCLILLLAPIPLSLVFGNQLAEVLELPPRVAGRPSGWIVFAGITLVVIAVAGFVERYAYFALREP